jgi:hypothetical protein
MAKNTSICRRNIWYYCEFFCVIIFLGNLALTKEEHAKFPVGHISVPFIIIKFCQMVGIHLSPGAVQELLESRQNFIITTVHILEFLPKVKYPAILDYHKAKYYHLQVNSYSENVYYF